MAFAVLDERFIWGVDLDEHTATITKERVAGHVWSRTVTLRPMLDLSDEDRDAARAHYAALGRPMIKEPHEVWVRPPISPDVRRKTGQRRLSINLISHDNAVGLTQDVTLLRALFAKEGHDIRFVEWRSGSSRADVNFYIELYEGHHLRNARAHVGLFNLEWFDKAQVGALESMTQLWAKSEEALRIYQGIGRRLPAHFTGFASRDLHRDEPQRERRCIHVKGKASQKATDIVIEAWRRHEKRLPPLLITAAQEFDGWNRAPGSVEIRFGMVPIDHLALLMNQHRIHLCPSETEGWGHYIAEALSCEAVVVTVDGSPMNEHVRPEFGVLLPAQHVPSGLVTRYRADPDALAEAVIALMAKDDAELERMGKAARAHWEVRQGAFASKALALLSHL